MTSRPPLPPCPLPTLIVGLGVLLTTQSQTFETYFDADIEVEKDIPPPFFVVVEGVATGDISVLLYPERWFERTDGTVWDLKSLEGQLVDFDLEIEEGFDLKID